MKWEKEEALPGALFFLFFRSSIHIFCECLVSFFLVEMSLREASFFFNNVEVRFFFLCIFYVFFCRGLVKNPCIPFTNVPFDPYSVVRGATYALDKFFLF